uniref:Polysaccharide lyase family 8 super-sandwich domain-containing protein n=1 Tax=Roseihalotalea indica TaxID=2867963 RepID=A0AA49JHE6_9BACT|nr:polysaccharide lyase family 8 super-sandwich domain-containing protein [Tunicatimonas sp. TK19036]
MKSTTCLLICVSFLFIQSAVYGQENDIQIIKSRLIDDAVNQLGFTSRTERYHISDFSKAEEYLRQMKPNGSWADVNYQDKDNDWSPLTHLDRLVVMAINYVKDTSALYQDGTLLEGLERGLTYWYQINPICDNWYKNVIGKQFYFNILGLLLQDKIDNILHTKIVNDLTEAPSMTGSNRTLVAISTLFRGVLEDNTERVQSGVNGVTDQVVITDDEGIQRDYSFHQHGHFIYNGNYGSDYLRESLWLGAMVHGTRFAYTPEQIQILRNYYLKGSRWMLRGGLMDYNVRGRQVGRLEGFQLRGHKLLQQLDHFMIVDPEYRAIYQASKQAVEQENPQDISGNKHFWRSDYTVHHRDGYFTSVKMCSNRTTGIELDMNSENKLGYWLPYGLTYLYRRGDEYLGVFPVWDWARLPGVTSPHVEIVRKGAFTQSAEFVGGVSDSTYGISAMDYSQEKTQAKKAWFWFDDEWVALGAGITSSHQAAIVTGVNQTLMKSDVVVDGVPFEEGSKTLTNPHWVWHDSVGYVFPGSESVRIKAEPQSGNLQRIYGLGKDTVYTEDVFSLWFDHGKKPRSDAYEYIVVPATDTAALSAYQENPPVTILSNSAEVQAVSHQKLQLTGMAFYQAGELMISDELTVIAADPVLIMVDLNKEVITVSDPTTRLQKTHIILTKTDGQRQRIPVEFPTGDYAGSSVKISGIFDPIYVQKTSGE